MRNRSRWRNYLRLGFTLTLLSMLGKGLCGCSSLNTPASTADREDERQLSQILEAKPLGEPGYWHSASSGLSYTVVPLKNVRIQANPYCREYRLVTNRGETTEEIYGRACRQENGSWLPLA